MANRSIAVLGLLLIAFGCNKESGSSNSSASASSSGGMAVVNVDRIAETLGWKQEMQKDAQATAQEVEKQLKGRVDAAREAVEKTKREIADALHLTPAQITVLNHARTPAEVQPLGLSAQQINALVQASAVYRNESQQVNSAVQELVGQRQQGIRQAYMEALSPAIRRVSASTGKTMVFTVPSPNLIYSDVSVDMTDRVIEDLQKQPPVRPSIPPVKFEPAATQAATQPATTLPTTLPAGTTP